MICYQLKFLIDFTKTGKAILLSGFGGLWNIFVIKFGPGGMNLKFHVVPNFQSMYTFDIEFDRYENGTIGI